MTLQKDQNAKCYEKSFLVLMIRANIPIEIVYSGTKKKKNTPSILRLVHTSLCSESKIVIDFEAIGCLPLYKNRI